MKTMTRWIAACAVTAAMVGAGCKKEASPPSKPAPAPSKPAPEATPSGGSKGAADSPDGPPHGEGPRVVDDHHADAAPETPEQVALREAQQKAAQEREEIAATEAALAEAEDEMMKAQDALANAKDEAARAAAQKQLAAAQAKLAAIKQRIEKARAAH